MLIIHRDESSKSEPWLVDTSVWLLNLNLSGMIFFSVFYVYVVVQFYLWFNFQFPLFKIHYHILT